MRRIIEACISRIVSVAILILASTAVLHAQDPLIFDNGVAPGTANICPVSDDNVPRRQADDVVFTESKLITTIEWVGFFGNAAPPPPSNEFAIAIYSDQNGTPHSGTPLAEFHVGPEVLRTDLGGNGTQFRAPINFTMQGETVYWISIRDTSLLPNIDFCWSGIAGNGNNAFATLSSGWTQGPQNIQLNFKLYGVDGQDQNFLHGNLDPTTGNACANADTDFDNNRIADDVQFSQRTTITEIRWIGRFDEVPAATQTNGFLIGIYSDNNGVPLDGPPIVEFNTANNTERQDLGNGFYLHTRQIYFTMEANNTYWISIKENDVGDAWFCWWARSGASNSAQSLNNGPWTTTPGGLRMHFNLFGIETPTWTGGGDNVNWNDPLNWSPNSVPTPADDAIFDGTAAQVSFPPVAQANRLLLNGGANCTYSGGSAAFNEFIVGEFAGSGTSSMTLTQGVVVDSVRGSIAKFSGSNGFAHVADPGTIWNCPTLLLGQEGNGELRVSNGGVVNSSDATMGFSGDGVASATVTGVNVNPSLWDISSDFVVGQNKTSSLTIEQGGVIRNGNNGFVAINSEVTGTVNVRDDGSKWENLGSLILGGSATTDNGGNATLIVENDGMVTVANTTKLWSGAILNLNVNGFLFTGALETSGGNLNISGGSLTVDGGGTSFINQGQIVVHSGIMDLGSASYQQTTGLTEIFGGEINSSGFDVSGGSFTLDGGRFDFEACTYDQFVDDSLDLISGILVGEILSNGMADASEFPVLNGDNLDVSGSVLVNHGILAGSGRLNIKFRNEFGSELSTFANDSVRFEGVGNINKGEINNLGGTVDFANDLTNQFDGIIEGYGNFFVDGGLTNEGVIALTGDFNNVFGDIDNVQGVLPEFDGVIVTSGGATTTFYDDMINNGEIRTSAGGNTVIFGGASGAGSYTGTGDCFMEGDLRPGNSPAIVTFEGNLSLGTSATTEIEIGGLIVGDEFDQLSVAGDLSLSGFLNVVFMDGFVTGPGQQFMIAQVGGSLSGTFAGLPEGTLVPGSDLTITYTGGDGNDIVLFTDDPVIVGDVNCDGVVNLLDVEPFIAALSSGQYDEKADANQDGFVNLLDVEPFIAILSGG